MDNQYFLIIRSHKDDRYNFIELFDEKDNLYYKIDNGKIEKDYLLKFDIFKENKIPLDKKKFYWILEQKFLIRNVDKEYLLKALGLHEWII